MTRKIINYSIVIRTVGTAGEKYQKLLECIDNLEDRPNEVIVVLPHGYNEPPEKLGYEKFVSSKKGMVEQRIYGGQIANSEYILFLDDDVYFEKDFIKKMSKPILEKQCDVTIPPELTMLPPKKGIKKIIPMLTLAACPTIFNKNMYVKILKSGGWSYNHYSQSPQLYLYTESAAGPCCFCRKKDFLDINFKEDLWLQDVQYPLWEDQVMFYKFILNKKKIFCVTNVKFKHLDAGKNSPDRNIKAAYANSRNKYIFWHKYIYLKQNNLVNKILSKMAYSYSKYSSLFISLLLSLRGEEKKKEYAAYRAGFKDGINFIKKSEIERG